MADNIAITAGAGTNVATDERTINAVTVHVQRIGEIGAAAVATGHVSASSTAATLLAARDTRKSMTFINYQTVAIYIGIATVTTTSGIMLAPGAALTIYSTALVQAITAAAYTASGEDTKVHYIEVYD